MNMMFVVFVIAMWQAQLEFLNVFQPKPARDSTDRLEAFRV